MKESRWLIGYRSRPGAVVAMTLGLIGVAVAAFLVLMSVVHRQPVDYSIARVRAMCLYFVVGVVLFASGLYSLLRVVPMVEQQRAEIDARRSEDARREAEWDIPMGDPRRSDSDRFR